MTAIERDGVRVDLPSGWEASLYRRSDAGAGDERPLVSGDTLPLILHAANFALPVDTADYGGGAVELMDRGAVFVALVEFGSGSAGQALFAADGVPALTADEFSPNGLQRAIGGQSGAQRWFHAGVRAFGLYVVLGSHTMRGALVKEANRLLAGVTIS